MKFLSIFFAITLSGFVAFEALAAHNCPLPDKGHERSHSFLTPEQLKQYSAVLCPDGDVCPLTVDGAPVGAKKTCPNKLR